MNRLQLDLNGVRYLLPEAMRHGDSFFIPSLDHKRMIEAIRKVYAGQQYRLTYQERIEEDILGIRVWRTG